MSNFSRISKDEDGSTAVESIQSELNFNAYLFTSLAVPSLSAHDRSDQNPLPNKVSRFHFTV